MSRCHRSKISRSQRSRGPVNMAEKKNEKNGLYNFRVYECTREQNGSPYFCSIVQQCKWPSLSRKIVEIQKFCYRGNLTSHFLLYGPYLGYAWAWVGVVANCTMGLFWGQILTQFPAQLRNYPMNRSALRTQH